MAYLLLRTEKGGYMKEQIRNLRLEEEFYTPERCYIIEQLNSPEDPHASIARARVPPGITTRWHRLTTTTERYYILSGRALVEVGELAPRDVGPGDVVLIPPMCRQRITNTGPDELIFLAICTPRFVDTEYQDFEDVKPS
jgi:mannose-6-phosphate isomerase-like protein (cupin superfamily)